MGNKKDEKAFSAIKQYLSNISKKEREQIQRELEQEAEDPDEEPPYKPINFQNAWIPYKPLDNQFYYFTNTSWAMVPSNWIETEQKSEIEEEAQDVSFED